MKPAHNERAMVKHQLAYLLRSLMSEHGVDAEWLAKRTGLSHACISEALNATGNPKAEVVADLFLAFGAAVHITLRGIGKPEKDAPGSTPPPEVKP